MLDTMRVDEADPSGRASRAGDRAALQMLTRAAVIATRSGNFHRRSGTAEHDERALGVGTEGYYYSTVRSKTCGACRPLRTMDWLHRRSLYKCRTYITAHLKEVGTIGGGFFTHVYES